MVVLIRKHDWQDAVNAGGVDPSAASAAIVRSINEFYLVDQKHDACPPSHLLRPATADGTAARTLPPAAGPGTELKKLLAAFGIVASPTCGCNAMAAKMDAAGPDGSEAMLPEILAVMRTEAEKRGLPFIEAAARLLVKKAIRTARAAR